ncbi:SEC-C motif-containing protein [Desulfonatronum zhilinae]|nr:SEC-C motif-containing protein [Desulfonatronum zhilinae]
MQKELSDFIDLERFMRDAVAEILRHEDSSGFMDWARQALPDYLGQNPQLDQIDAMVQDQLATVLARMIWNSTPLPGNDFRPQPLPAPRRNDRCDCGSGKKYKQCCAMIPSMEALDEEAFWHIVVDTLPHEELISALERKRIPRNVITSVAERFLERGQGEMAVTILESMFTGKLNRLDPEMGEYAFDLLMDAYDRRLQVARKVAIIERILANAPRGPLRSVALQRKATMLADQGNLTEAWEAFSQAMRDDPESLSLCILELQLLMVESRWQQAKDRAVFWHAKITKLADKLENPQRLLDFLRSVMENPQEARKSMMAPSLDWDEDDLDEIEEIVEEDAELMDRIQRLQTWIVSQVNQPMKSHRAYPLEHFGKDREDGHKKLLLKFFASIGVADDAPEVIVTETMQALQDEVRDPESLISQMGLDTCRVIQPEDDDLMDLEQSWGEVFPMPKPRGVVVDDDQDDGESYVWEKDDFEEWMELLEEHPEAIGSLYILDDLLLAMLQLPDESIPVRSISASVAMLSQRAGESIKQVKLEPEEKLPWLLPQNRPMLRCLARYIEMHLALEDMNEVERSANLYLRLNPTDEENMVSLLGTALLRLGKDDQVLSLAEDNPENGRPELAYCRAIALFRQGRKDDAESAMVEAMENFPIVPEYLFEPEIGEPDEDDYEGDEDDGFTFHDANVAWDYARMNRDFWESVPGLMEWAEELFDRMEEEE